MNLKMLDFAVNSLKRRVWKNLSLFFIFSLLVFLLTTVFLVSFSIKKELDITLKTLPDIFVQKIVAGRLELSEIDRVFEISDIAGVSEVSPRVWGYYYFPRAGVNFSVIGVDFDLSSYKKSFNEAIKKYQDLNSSNFMIVGRGVEKVLKENYYKDFFNFVKPDGEMVRIELVGVFNAKSAIESNDVILLPIETAREIFGIDEEMVTDIAVKVPNPVEIPTVANKISLLYPDSRVLTKNDIKASYQNIFDYKSGIFLSLLITSFFAFFILVYEKTSSAASDTKKEIGILKALGWRTEDVLRLKFFESSIISFGAYMIGILAAYGYVYILQAPLIRDIFTGYSHLKPPFELIPVFEISLLANIFLATVPVYIAATIIPSWRASTVDPEEAIRQ
ncbi:ABC transporter permease [Nitrosophilus alvini]|uniref:ABC transporter permease n=1 Tax=Nitrosophilus alvini TaxID=2714855 RepID=UPI00190D660E|nr:FtsX-like permease family protein [Nitrosophilus alvini]